MTTINLELCAGPQINCKITAATLDKSIPGFEDNVIVTHQVYDGVPDLGIDKDRRLPLGRLFQMLADEAKKQYVPIELKVTYTK